MKPIFEAVMESDRAVLKLLSKSRELSQARADEDHLVESIPHWVYAGDTPLHLASAALRIGTAKLLLEHGADVQTQNRRGATALHYACDPRPNSGGVWNPEAQAALIELLIRHGANVNVADKGKATALHRAVRARSAAAVRCLLENGARVDVGLGKLGSLPLHLAVQSTGASGTADSVEEQLEIIGLLLKHGARAIDEDSRGRSALEWAASDRIISALKAGS